MGTYPNVSIREAYSVQILRTYEEVESVRTWWQKWQSHPNTDLDHYLLVCRMRANVRRPHVIMVSYQNEPHAILVGRLEQNHIPLTIGYFRPVCFPVTSISVLYRGLLGEINGEIAEVLIQTLRHSLATGEAETVELYHFDEGSPLLRTALKRNSRLQRDAQARSSTHWEINLSKPSCLMQNLSSQHRAWIQRKSRKLERAFSGRFVYQSFPRGGDIRLLCLDLEAVASTAYQRSLGAGFVNDPEHRERLMLFNRRDSLRAWILRIDNVPRAFYLGIVYQKVFYASETALDPAFRSFDLGTLTFLYMADELSKEGISKLDLGLGDAFYKQRFGDRSWREQTLRLYSPSAKGFAALIFAEAGNIITCLAYKFLNCAGGVGKLKTAWRRRLRTKAQSRKA